MRRVFQFDGLNGEGVLSVGECEQEAQVAIVIHQGGKEMRIFLSEADFADLADLRYRLRFAKPDEVRHLKIA